MLGFLYPGLGHVYLRRWLRAFAWFLLALATAALVVPPSTFDAFQAGGVSGLMEASESFGLKVTLSLLTVRMLNVADAYFVAVRDTAVQAAQDAAPGEAENCPECGGELDEVLDFCPWCTTRFEDAEADEVEPAEDAESV